jgi:hypothetical protein
MFKMNAKKMPIVAVTLGIAAVIVFGTVAVSQHNAQAQEQPPQDQGELFVAQNTAQSGPDPLPGHSMHQAVLVLPPRDDGMIWDGDITWTASKNVEIVVLHNYNGTGVDDQHGEPLNAPLTENGTDKVAISLYSIPSNTPAPSGSTHFTGTALAFHNIKGEPFTVTYSVKATASSPTG